MNCDYLKNDWNLSYGITKSHNDSSTKQKNKGKYSNSIYLYSTLRKITNTVITW